jgi:hypothetical protein
MISKTRLRINIKSAQEREKKELKNNKKAVKEIVVL